MRSSLRRSFNGAAVSQRRKPLDIRRGRRRLPERLEHTRAGTREFLLRQLRTAVPPLEIGLRQFEETRVLPPGTPAALRTVMATGLLRPVDLVAEERARQAEAATRVEREREDKLFAVERAFIEGRNPWQELRRQNARGGVRVTPAEVFRRITGTRVQIEKTRHDLARAKTPEESTALRRRLELLMRRHKRELQRRLPRPARRYAVPRP